MVLFCILVSTPSSFLGNRSPINYPYDRVCLFCKHFVMGDSELLERLELSAKKSSFPEELSGGQQQRVAIARALIMKPSIVLADEPTGNLDSKTGSKVFRLLLDVCKRFDQTLLLVTHNE